MAHLLDEWKDRSWSKSYIIEQPQIEKVGQQSPLIRPPQLHCIVSVFNIVLLRATAEQQWSHPEPQHIQQQERGHDPSEAGAVALLGFPEPQLSWFNVTLTKQSYL